MHKAIGIRSDDQEIEFAEADVAETEGYLSNRVQQLLFDVNECHLVQFILKSRCVPSTVAVLIEFDGERWEMEASGRQRGRRRWRPGNILDDA